MRPAPVTRMDSASQPPVCANAKLTAGALSVSSCAPAAPTGVVNPLRAHVSVTQAGGHPRVAAHASASQEQAVTQTRAPACALQAGGAAAAASAAPATPRLACRTPVAAYAWRAGGALSASGGVSAYEATAMSLLASAPAHLASKVCTVSCPAIRAAMGHSAAKGELATGENKGGFG